jgi:hypothetical protein
LASGFNDIGVSLTHLEINVLIDNLDIDSGGVVRLADLQVYRCMRTCER